MSFWKIDNVVKGQKHLELFVKKKKWTKWYQNCCNKIKIENKNKTSD